LDLTNDNEGFVGLEYRIRSSETYSSVNSHLNEIKSYELPMSMKQGGLFLKQDLLDWAFEFPGV
jgi:hypothetical protein